MEVAFGEDVWQKTDLARIFHESEAFIGKAFKDAAVLRYRKSLITKHMEASGSPKGWIFFSAFYG